MARGRRWASSVALSNWIDRRSISDPRFFSRFQDALNEFERHEDDQVGLPIRKNLI